MGINVKDVDFSYNRKRKNNSYLFNKLNIDINSTDEFITVVGTTGSGKSTFAQMLNALLLPIHGCIYISDYKVLPKHNKNLKKVRKEVGLVFQFPEYQLFEESVIKDVMFGPLNYKIKKDQALKQAQESLEKLHFDKKLYDVPPFNLSGGQKRLVSIAGILALNPNVIIFDEPTVGLDYKAKQLLINILKMLHKDYHKTIIVITHDMNFVAENAKRVVVFNNGNITYDGNTIDLFNDKEFLKNNNLDLPFIASMAEGLKESGLINYDKIPLTTDELERVIRGDHHE